MLMRAIGLVFVVAVVATQVPGAFEALKTHGPNRQGEAPAARPVAVARTGTTVLEADATGHYRGTFRLNGKAIEAMVDTGASLVAINETTARRIGVSIASLDFQYPINTANGETRAAHVRLQRVEIGSVRVEDVDAFVLRDKALSGTLIGMSFLKRLGGYSAEGDRLRLER
ncbi:MAG: TIGR02281 family clan AA aspartic protease [Rhizobium sp.]|nr:TIGR02281 family clan AA aspartic protease [Rhizobium sp.]